MSVEFFDYLIGHLSYDKCTCKMPDIIDLVSAIESDLNSNTVVVDVTPEKIPKTSNVTFVRQNSLSAAKAEELLFSEPTFSERFLRYLWVFLYLCGLCSLGFVLSIYHLFFWDSKMPPVYKPAIKKSIPVITLNKY